MDAAFLVLVGKIFACVCLLINGFVSVAAANRGHYDRAIFHMLVVIAFSIALTSE